MSYSSRGRYLPMSRPVIAFFLLSTCLLFSLFALPPHSDANLAQNPQPKSDGKRTRPQFVPGDILVRYRSEAVARAESRGTKTLRYEGTSLALRHERLQASDLVPGLRLVRVPDNETTLAISALRKQPNVLYAEPNYILRADLDPNDPLFSQPGMYGMLRIGAPQFWETQRGNSSVVIGIVDEGFELTHEDLTNNKWVNNNPGQIPGIVGDLNGYNFAARPRSGSIPAEEHGTHVAGIAGAEGNNGVGVVGVNWDVSLMSLRVLDEVTGVGRTSDIIDAYSYAKEMRDLWVSSNGMSGANIRVLNNSYGGSGFSQASFDAISALNQAGILFVASAGNDAANSDVVPHYPSGYNLPNIISVAATNSLDQLWIGSNFGAQTVALGAPGQGVLSTLPGSTYGSFTGTSMATPHVSGSAALLWAQNPSLTLPQVKALLIFNGDELGALGSGKTLTGRRLNVFKSFQAVGENDIEPPGMVTNFRVTSQNGRTITLAWTDSGDDGPTGRASLYEVSFTDQKTGAVLPLKKLIPVNSGVAQTLEVKIPYQQTKGRITLREFDNVGNEGIPAFLDVTVPFADGDPYAVTLGFQTGLTTGGTKLDFNCDDCFEIEALPFNFTYYGQAYNTIKISSNGNIFFEPPTAPTRPNGDSDDVPSLISVLNRYRMISGLWDDIDLRTSVRADADVYRLTPSPNRVIYRWQGVPCNFDSQQLVCTGGGPINFEIELQSDGTIKSRYGTGNQQIFPVVGISGGEPDSYVVPSHTSEFISTNLTNAAEITYIPRSVINPLDNNFFFISQQYRDFLGREPDLGGLGFWASDINSCGTDQICLIRRRVGISAAFFVEAEFQRTGSFVYRSFKGGLGRRPNFAEFSADRPQIVEGPTLEQTKQAYLLAFVQRPEFTAKYATATTANAFVDALIASINTNSGVDLSSMQQALINKYQTGGNMNESRALATRDAIDAMAFQDAEYNAAFVLMQYFGYLVRDPEPAGFLFWLDVLNNRVPNNFQGMVCAFITSAEYQRRFSNLIPHSDSECGPPAF